MAPGSGPSPSFRIRREKPVLSAVRPRRTMPTVRPSGKGYGGVQGAGPVPAEAQGIGDIGDGRGQPVDGGEGIEPLHEDAPPGAGDGMAVHEFVQVDAFLTGQAAKPVGGEVEPSGRGDDVGGVGERGGETAALQPLHGLVDRAPGPAGDGDHLQSVEEGHRSQGAEQVGLTSFGSHSATSSVAFRPASLPAGRLRLLVCFLRSGSRGGGAACPCSPFSRSSAFSRKSCTFFWASASASERSWAVRVYLAAAARMRAATAGSPGSGLRTIIEKAGIRSLSTVART